MRPLFRRALVPVYALLLVLCGLGYARYANYQMDGDAVAFMDIAGGLLHGHPEMAINGYWNPAYSVVLAAGQELAHSNRFHELQVSFDVNFFIFVCAICACLFFTQGLVVMRRRLDPVRHALEPYAVHLAGLALMFYSFQSDLSLGAVRSDSLLLVFFLLAAGLILRIQAGSGLPTYLLLGLMLGLAYLTKSFALVPSAILLLGMMIFGLTRRGPAEKSERRKIVTGTVLTGVVFLALAGPYIAAISRQYGHLTTGESARMNYAFFIDHMARWHEWHGHAMGHAGGTFVHAEQVLAENPPVYSYAAHPVGTYPLWFDPAYWAAGLKPHIYLRGQVERWGRCAALLVRYGINHPEGILLLLVLLAYGATLPRKWREWMPWVPVMGWGVLMLAIYFMVDLQDRYLTTSLLLFCVPTLALLRARDYEPARGMKRHAVVMTASALVILLAGLSLADAARDLGERRRLLSPTGHEGWYNKNIFEAAHALNQLGLGKGMAVACMGDKACFLDQYWARLADTPIRAEIGTPNDVDPQDEWEHIADKTHVTAPLEEHGIHAIVAIFPDTTQKPTGWVQLGASDFYAYSLTQQ
jgi:hypothetical protein